MPGQNGTTGRECSQRAYRHAVEEFVEWYCSEPRLSFSRTVVLCYRIHLESRHSASGLRLGGFVIHANLGNLGRLLAGLQ